MGGLDHVLQGKLPPVMIGCPYCGALILPGTMACNKVTIEQIPGGCAICPSCKGHVGLKAIFEAAMEAGWVAPPMEGPPPGLENVPAKFLDLGYVYAPYVPLVVTPAFVDIDTASHKSMVEKYSSKLVKQEYYGKLSVPDCGKPFPPLPSPKEMIEGLTKTPAMKEALDDLALTTKDELELAPLMDDPAALTAKMVEIAKAKGYDVQPHSIFETLIGASAIQLADTMKALKDEMNKHTNVVGPGPTSPPTPWPGSKVKAVDTAALEEEEAKAKTKAKLKSYWGAGKAHMKETGHQVVYKGLGAYCQVCGMIWGEVEPPEPEYESFMEGDDD